MACSSKLSLHIQVCAGRLLNDSASTRMQGSSMLGGYVKIKHVSLGNVSKYISAWNNKLKIKKKRYPKPDIPEHGCTLESEL